MRTNALLLAWFFWRP